MSAGQEPDAAARRDSRHRAREAALQMLYQWEVGRTDIDEVVQTYWAIERPDERPLATPLQAFATDLARGTVALLERIDHLIAEHTEHWRPSRMAVIDREILRLAIYEFLSAEDVPKKVVINEALELARTFSADEAIGFVNGILDAVKRALEDGETHERP